MEDKNCSELVELGLSPTEAQVYLVLVQTHAVSASAIATASGLSRTAVYQILCALTDKGLIESGAGYGSKFVAAPPEQALPTMVARDDEILTRRKEIAATLSQRLAALAESIEEPVGELIQVIRSPRAVLERFERLQLEAKRQIDVFSKPPYFNRGGNEAEERALKRGVRARAIYEKQGVEDPAIAPYFQNWITAGEEARIYDGELPHKMVIFDGRIALMPLIIPGEQMRALLIRNVQLAESLSLAFQFIWDRSQPVIRAARKKAARTRKAPIHRTSRDGRYQSRHA